MSDPRPLSPMWDRARALLATDYPDSQLRIGFFERPAPTLRSERPAGRSHLVDTDTVPICGQPVQTDMTFRLVSRDVLIDMVECAKCLRKLRQTVREATA